MQISVKVNLKITLQPYGSVKKASKECGAAHGATAMTAMFAKANHNIQATNKTERLQLPRDWTGKSPCSLVPACTKKLQAVRTHIALGFPKIEQLGM